MSPVTCTCFRGSVGLSPARWVHGCPAPVTTCSSIHASAFQACLASPSPSLRAELFRKLASKGEVSA